MINDKNIELRKLAALFDGLGHYRRLLVVRALQQAGAKGLSFGALAEATGIGETNLAHHVRMMGKGGVINTHNVGRFTFLTLNMENIAHSLAELNLHISPAKTVRGKPQ
ncbi:MAG: winged helix-turn-helix transcriptional regulator [Robiginitomaculum sp.]|nr:winged helix-turn-helix transcriptional regulator [Robiginitomaculum sp.]